MAAGAGIELQDVQVRGGMDEAGARELRIDGFAKGTVPRETADHFRQALETGLRQHFGRSAMTARFERLEDEPDASGVALSDQRRASFTIIAAAGVKELPGPEQHNER